MQLPSEKKNTMHKSIIFLVVAFIFLEAPNSVLLAQMFAPKVDYTVGLRPYTIVSADFNKDGRFDLATAPSGGFDSDGKGWVTVLMNKGDATFAPPESIAVGDAPSLATADLDKDGDIDFAAADYYTNRVYILLNDGAGRFTLSDSFAIGGLYALQLCTADLDGDGDIDLAVPKFGSNNLAIFFNNGNATFSAPVTYATGVHPYTVISADLDHDGDSDLVVTNNGSQSVSIMLNNGTGVFPSRVDYTVRQNPQSPSLADYNGDGCLDLAVPNTNPNTPYVSVLMGNCGGTFGTRVDYLGYRPHDVASGDLDRDGDIDMAVPNNESNSISIFLNNGNGTFAPHFTLQTGIGPNHIVTKDFDADGDLDLAVENFDNDGAPGNTVSVFVNQTITSVSDESGSPKTYSLDQNYPNPFNPSTTINYSIPERSNVKLYIYNTLGQKISDIVNETKDAGSYEHSFNASQLSSGIYFYRIEATSVSNSKTFVETKKMVLMK